VTVLEYVPAKTFAGTATETVALTFVVPRPVALAAFSNFTAAGAAAAAGTARFVFATLFVGTVQVEPAPHAVATLVIVDALAGNVWPDESVKVVDVIVRFQPPPAARPRASTMLTGSV
jgi:hypothetical protein